MYDSIEFHVLFGLKDKNLSVITGPDSLSCTSLLSSYRFCNVFVPKNISVTTHFNKLEDSNFILDLNSLYENDQYLYNHFLNYLEKHNRLYVDYLLSFIINEKVEIIKKQCIKWDKLVELCWYDFINT